MERTKLAEGKTKIIWGPDPHDDPDGRYVLIESKDDITAGDGAKHDLLENKSVLATTTTVNCFTFLRKCHVPTHFLYQVNERTFRAERVSMIPLELVVRRLATGSYLKRHPEVAEGTVLPAIVEFFAKNDDMHDPLVIHDFAGSRVLYFDAKKPMGQGYIMEKSMDDPGNIHAVILELRRLAAMCFGFLEIAWGKLGVTLVDLKIECGYGLGSQLVVADVIDNDSWRIWPGGDKTEMKDKQVYRNLEHASAAELGKIKENYAWVAAETSKFIL